MPLQTSYTGRTRKATLFFAKGFSITEIAEELGCDKFIISREHRRIRNDEQYLSPAT